MDPGGLPPRQKGCRIMTNPQRVRLADQAPCDATDFPEAPDRPDPTPRAKRGSGRQPGDDSARAAFPELARPRAIQNLAHDRPMSLPDAAAYLGRITGQKPHVSTIWRWCLKGCKGVRLESICIGGKRFVTAAAIDDFIDASTRRRPDGQLLPPAAPPRPPAHVMRHNERRRAEIEAARRRVDELTGVTKRSRPGQPGSAAIRSAESPVRPTPDSALHRPG